MRLGPLIRPILKSFEKLGNFYNQAKEFTEKVGNLRQEVGKAIQAHQDGNMPREVLEDRLSQAITELNERFPEDVSQRLEAIDPNWESKVLGIPEEYLPTESNATSANSELSAEELAEAFMESLNAGDFHFAVATNYIAESMTDSELDLFLTEIRNSEPTASTETLNNESTSEEIIEQIVERVSDGMSIEELSGIVEDIQTHNLNSADIIAELNSRIETGSAVSPSEAHEMQDTDYNCGPTLAKVVLAQHGIHISEGELTLRAFLEGTFDLTQTTECFEFLFGLFGGCITTSALGTRPMSMGYILEKSGLPVDINYRASLEDIEIALADGKSVIVAVDVEPIWNVGSGGHVLQVLHIDHENSEVTVNDTGRPDGDAIKYELKDFKEACEKYMPEDGILMIVTEEPSPRANIEARQEPISETAKNPTGGTNYVNGDYVYVNGDRIETTPEHRNILNKNPDPEDETGTRETAEITDPQAPSGGSLGNSNSAGDLSASQDERTPTETSETETEQPISKDSFGTDHGSINNPISPPGTPDPDKDTGSDGEMEGDIAGGLDLYG